VLHPLGIFITFYVISSLLAKPLFGCHCGVSVLLLECQEHHHELRRHAWHDWRNSLLACFLWSLALAPSPCSLFFVISHVDG
jgi:hypothetical protein